MKIKSKLLLDEKTLRIFTLMVYLGEKINVYNTNQKFWTNFNKKKKDTLGLTAQWSLRDLINKKIFDLDVGLIKSKLKQNLQKKDCSPYEILHDLSSNRCKPDWFLSTIRIKLN